MQQSQTPQKKSRKQNLVDPKTQRKGKLNDPKKAKKLKLSEDEQAEKEISSSQQRIQDELEEIFDDVEDQPLKSKKRSTPKKKVKNDTFLQNIMETEEISNETGITDADIDMFKFKNSSIHSKSFDNDDAQSIINNYPSQNKVRQSRTITKVNSSIKDDYSNQSICKIEENNHSSIFLKNLNMINESAKKEEDVQYPVQIKQTKERKRKNRIKVEYEMNGKNTKVFKLEHLLQTDQNIFPKEQLYSNKIESIQHLQLQNVLNKCKIEENNPHYNNFKIQNLTASKQQIATEFEQDLPIQVINQNSSNHHVRNDQAMNSVQIEVTKHDRLLENCKKIFPYDQPYQNQVESMKNILQSLMGNKNLLFQSPTGTGKTLMTICAALTYIEEHHKDIQILFLTRTNEQINGLIKELRKIKNFKNINQYAILSGRSQFCLKSGELDTNQESEQQKNMQKNQRLDSFCKELIENTFEKMKIKDPKETNKQMEKKQKIADQKYQKCKDLFLSDSKRETDIRENEMDNEQESEQEQVQINEEEKKEEVQGYNKNYCQYYEAYQPFYSDYEEDFNTQFSFPYVKSDQHSQYTLPDIEDMKELFQKQELGCPYFHNKLALKTAKIIFGTYNYLLKPNILNAVKNVFTKDLIVIFDEGHNITEQAEKEQAINLKSDHWLQFLETAQGMVGVFAKYPKLIRSLIQNDIQMEYNYFKVTLLNRQEKEQSKQNQSNPFSQNEKLNHSESQLSDIFNETEGDLDIESDMEEDYKPVSERIQSKEEIGQKSAHTKSDKKNRSNDLYSRVINKIKGSFNRLERNQEGKQVELLQKLEMLLSNFKAYPNNDYSNQLDSFLDEYQKLRFKEICTQLDQYQENFMSIIEFCENLRSYFEEVRKEDEEVRLFCRLFNEINFINQHFDRLNISDIDLTKQFLKNMDKIFYFLSYIKYVIIIQSEIIQSRLNTESVEDIFGKEGGIFHVSDDDNSLEEFQELSKIEKNIKLQTCQTVRKFYKRLLEMKEEQDKNKNSEILQDHYFSIMRDSKENLPFLEIGCLQSEKIFKNITSDLEVQSLVFTSGTLEPFDLIKQSTKLEFDTYSSSHVIDPKTNIFTQFVDSYKGQDISFSYQKTKKEDKQNTVVQDALQVMEAITKPFLLYTKKARKKSGIVVFFKNYSQMNEFFFPLRNHFQKDFKIFKEQSEADQFKIAFQSYKEQIQQNIKNCIFLAVHRGKLSEGIDLKDELCRTVILLGVPYPYCKDPYIICKKKHASNYQNEKRWYEKVTVKVLNQSAGRCIRYKDDWGAIFFIGKEFNQNDILSNISKWIIEGQKLNIDNNNWEDSFQSFLNHKLNFKQ